MVGTLFQDPETQIVMTTVRAELAFGLENRGEGPRRSPGQSRRWRWRSGSRDLLDRSTDELSGGELQRVALGAALAGRPELVVLDEPTSQLDPVAGDELIGLLRRCNEDFDTTIVLSEHRLERCLAAADRVIALRDGRVACDAAPDEFLVWAGRGTGASDARREAARCRRACPARRQAGAGGAARTRPAAADRSRSGCWARPAQPRPIDRDAWPRPAQARSQREAQAALEFRGVWHELRSGPVILRDVSLRLAPGERVALMGRNGAGKSTLLRHAAGLQQPTRGRFAAPAGSRCCCRTPTTTWSTSASARRRRTAAAPRRARAPGVRRAPPTRAVRGRAPAARARDRARRRRRSGGRGVPRRADPGHGPRAQGAARRTAATGSTPRCWSRPTIPSSSRRSRTAWCCSPTGR